MARNDHREKALALARALHAAILAYNRAHPIQPYAIDDAASRILENDPDYHPPRKRSARKQRVPTSNPGIFTVRAIATALDTTVGELLGEPGYELTKSDLRTFRWIANFFQMRFELDQIEAIPDAGNFVQKDFSRPHPLTTTKLANQGQLAAGVRPVESEFELTDANIIGDLKSATLAAATVTGRSMSDRMRHGDTIVIDTARTTPRLHEPVAVYVEDEGGILGYWRAEAGAYFLDKHNPEYASYKLAPTSDWRVLGVIVLIQSPAGRQDRPAMRIPR